MKIILIAFLFLNLMPLKTYAKNVNSTGAMTFFSLAAKIGKYSSLNFYHYDIYNFTDKDFQDRKLQRGVDTTYFQTSYSYQYLPSINLTAGHIYQRTNPFVHEFRNENRVFEQVTFAKTFRDLTMSHRFRFEQRFLEGREEDNIDFRTRLRYQIGAKIPLRGLVIDPNEYYINTYNEFYFSTTGERNALFSDDWAYAGVGRKTKHWGSFEIGPMVQWSRINRDKDTRTHYTIQVGWLVSF